jgi:Sel1 repeat
MRTIWKAGLVPVVCTTVVAGIALAWHANRANRKLAEAAAQTRQRAEKGDAQAQVDLAHLYYYGEGVPRNYADAAEWERKAANQGNTAAQAHLGYLYLKGQGVPQDYAQALLWIRKAADRSYVGAEDDVGYMYYHGEGVPQDYVEAMRRYRKAAAQGDGPAEFGLGIFYERGYGAPQDYAEAARWYRKAADQGIVHAQDNLGNLYFYGRGVPQDRFEAYRWFSKAAGRGDDYANRVLSKSMSPLGRFDIVAGLVGGLWLSLSFFRRQYSGPANLLGDSRQVAVALVGLLLIAYAGLSWYGYSHHKIRQLNLYPNTFTWARFGLLQFILALLLYVLFEIRKKRRRAAQ